MGGEGVMGVQVETAIAGRKLASVQVVNAVEPIEGADAIEKIRVQGWWVVVAKGAYQVGDRVVYCEIDSFLPEREEFEFLRGRCFREATPDRPAGFRIKTVRLRGQISQGIVFPVSILGDEPWMEEGADVTALLGILKFELPCTGGYISGQSKGSFPAFLSKTDEVRVQNMTRELRHCAGRLFSITEKLDGTSFTAFWRLGEFGVCSRNLLLDEGDENGMLIEVARRLGVKEKLQEFGFDVAVQGEVVGPGIQGNKYGLKERMLYVFNVIDLRDGGHLPVHVAERFGFQIVPQLGALELNHAIDELVEISCGKSVLNPKTEREGIVMRTADTSGGRLSFKVINPNFLLKYDE
jgi:RNA ligase (TIGR02306 family)